MGNNLNDSPLEPNRTDDYISTNFFDIYIYITWIRWPMIALIDTDCMCWITFISSLSWECKSAQVRRYERTMVVNHFISSAVFIWHVWVLRLPSLKLKQHLKIGHPKKKLLFQPSIFRGVGCSLQGNHPTFWGAKILTCFMNLATPTETKGTI